ncbi:3,4-dihydroxy-2-butanone 4-phosphate synthase [Arenicella chitinivorans]|uniref:3,4-dihydroxy-2-butanone 4-phosphate synthase n=1 Tax=Arenicella chitinivorans TaxID=1329800 RepID=A0A918VQV3_9GAMM|nr:3,4-dihydroxy-2-butanone-4-phosphate synthase [Arenicella chitinivorans]GHA15178.1 3,4-dihydroxy-2-butanone 4-phosphate synthase [Arenicella chitinivorans]
MALSSIEEILEDYRNGKMVIITDDEDRENEGDLMMAADHVRPEDINFMARYGRGLICLTLTEERCEKLGLPLMVGDNNGARFSTNFTMSIEAAEGVTTGISAADRARTVQAAVAHDAKPGDIVMPGHIFPIMAQPGGVLSRAGHTEAGIDFARLAGREPASVICEILNEDGTMARMPDLVKFAEEHDLKICSIAELIRYRLEKEPTVVPVEDTEIETERGKIRCVVFKDTERDETHAALIAGEVKPDVPLPVRIHVESDLLAVLKGLNNKATFPVQDAVDYILEAGTGIVVILRYAQNAEEVIYDIEQIKDNKRPGNQGHLRLLGAGSQILSSLGARQIQVMGRARKTHGLSGFDIEIVEYIEK